MGSWCQWSVRLLLRSARQRRSTDHKQFHVKIEQRLTLSEAAKAWELNRSGHTGGKIILEVSH